MSNTRFWLNTVMVGECREQMANLPANSIQCVVSSPPYWGLRDYGLPAVGWDNGDKCVLGLEDTPEQFIDHIVEVFRSVHRVLRHDGVLFVNLGDSYCGSGRGGYLGDRTGLQGSTTNQDQSRLARTTTSRRRDRAEIPRSDRSVPGRKVSELLNMPHRVAEALSTAGWYWRSTIIWQKRSPMPESLSGWRWVRCRNKTGRKPVDWSNRPKAFQPGLGTHDHIPHGNYMTASGDATVPVWTECAGCDKCRDTDGYILRRGKWRPTNSHEYVFMFSKSKDYFCDSDAVADTTSAPGPEHERKQGIRSRGETPKTDPTVDRRDRSWMDDSNGRQPSDGNLQRSGEQRFQSEGGGSGRVADTGQQPSWTNQSRGGAGPNNITPNERAEAIGKPRGCSVDSGLGNTLDQGSQRHPGNGDRSDQPGWVSQESQRPITEAGRSSWMADTSIDQREQRGVHNRGSDAGTSEERAPRHIADHGGDFWHDVEFIQCRDGKARPVKPGVRLLANGVSGRMAVVRTVEQAGEKIQETHWYSRVAALRGFGNAIVPQIAAVFIRSFMESINARL